MAPSVAVTDQLATVNWTRPIEANRSGFRASLASPALLYSCNYMRLESGQRSATAMQNQRYTHAKTKTPQVGAQSQTDAMQELLVEAKKIQKWNDRSSTKALRNLITTNKSFGVQGDRVLIELIDKQNPQSDSERGKSLWTDEPSNSDAQASTRTEGNFNGIGKQLLCLMLSETALSKFFVKEPQKPGGKELIAQKKPIHLAIEKRNLSFLACFLGICDDQACKRLHPRAHAALDGTDSIILKRNCVHYAIEHEIPFSPFMVRVCSAEALEAKDAEGYPPLHRAMEKMKLTQKSDVQPPMSSRGVAGAPGWDNTFDPPRILDEILKRKDDHLIATLLATTTNDGRSLFQEDLGRYGGTFKMDVKKLIFDKIRDISDIEKALYGTKGDVKELCLDMSDFNQSSHNFESFVNKLTKLDENLPAEQSILRFEDTLFFVHLPDLNYVKQPCPPHTIRRLFDWLKHKGVHTIKKLSIPDNSTNPLSDAFVQPYILEAFYIEELDWRKLDVNLDIITGMTKPENPNNDQARNAWESLADLTLYSSGNWSVLYHWISKDGLAKLKQLCRVRINIICLNPAEGLHDGLTRERYRSLATEYRRRLNMLHAENKDSHGHNHDLNFRFELDIKVDAHWDYPPPPHEPEEPTTQVLQHQFTSQLSPSFHALEGWEREKIDLAELDNLEIGLDEAYAENGEEGQDDAEKRRIYRFQQFALHDSQNNPSNEDQRVKVAIIDNGADRIRSKFLHMITRGQSWVTSDSLGSNKSLPWWMVSDPHGTQMAALIGQTNDYCQLYIARVGKGRNDIQPTNAAKAIRWAVEHKVDIISISWTLKREDKELEAAIKDAVEARTLMFCSTPDEGVYSEAWPVGYPDVISVSATNRYGHLTSQTAAAKPSDILIPGENIRVAGPSYIGNVLPTVSGSSVATALAAGIASLALLMLRTFNPHLGTANSDRHDDSGMGQFYSRRGIMRVFHRMSVGGAAIQLSKLFPSESMDESEILETLAKNWNVTNFPLPPES